MDAATVNFARWVPAQRGGHYESFFQRANHPSRPLAFWVRYTLFSPSGRAATRGAPAAGELWAVFFDGETGVHVAVKREVPISLARFDRTAFAVRVDDARFGPAGLSGAVASADHRIAWEVRYRGDSAPLFLFPPALYETRLPRAKSLVGLPLSVHEVARTTTGDRSTPTTTPGVRSRASTRIPGASSRSPPHASG
jgi:hypothetical protein